MFHFKLFLEFLILLWNKERNLYFEEIFNKHIYKSNKVKQKIVCQKTVFNLYLT